MTTNTIQLHRVLRAPPERVYRAFIDPAAMSKWLPPNGFTATIHHMDAKVGGSFRMSFTNSTTQSSMSFGGEYLELIPNEKLRYTDVFDDQTPRRDDRDRPSQRGLLWHGSEHHPGRRARCHPSEACYMGWQESLILLAKLVEAEIKE